MLLLDSEIEKLISMKLKYIRLLFMNKYLDVQIYCNDI